jgi:hypothetical protein
MKYPLYYLVSGSQGMLHQRDGLNTLFIGIDAKVVVNNCEQYGKFWAARLEYLKNAQATDIGQLS